MAELQESSKDRELALLLDVSQSGNSARACQDAEEFVERLAQHPVGVLVDLNAGDLLLTRGVLTKIKQQIQRAGAVLGTVYATVPQTQQAALDEGLYVKEKMATGWLPIRQSLPRDLGRPGKVSAATPPEPLSAKVPPVAGSFQDAPRPKKSAAGVNLPDFSQPRTAKTDVREDFVPVAPQSLDVPELNAPELVQAADVEKFEQVGLEHAQPVSGAETAEPQALPDAMSSSLEIETPEGAFETLYLRQTLRSGQTVRFNGNVIIVGDVHAGSEITAGGDILVWGELRGIAHAGAQGNYKSEIRAMKIEALQLRIADYIARRPDRIYYHKDGAETVISPEVARVADGEIKIFRNMLPRG